MNAPGEGPPGIRGPLDLAAVLASSVIPSGIAGPDDRFTWVNEALCSLLGRDEATLLSMTWEDFAAPEDLAGNLAQIADAMGGGAPSFRHRTRFLRAGAEERWVDLSLTVIRDAHGEPTGMLGQALDITAQIAADRALADSEERYRMLAENIGDVVVTGSMTGRLAWVSESVRGLLGWDPAELVDTDFRDLVHHEEHGIDDEVRRQIRRGRPAAFDARLRTKDGGWRWLRIRVQPTVDANGAIIGVVAAWQDINDRVEAATRLEAVLGTDALTGLPNRAAMVEKIEALRRQSGREDRDGVVLCIGIDRLGDVNSAINHAAGDLVVTTVARRIAECAPDVNLVGRGAGVDFLVLLPNLTAASDAVAIAERIRHEVKKEIVVDHRRVRVTASIGSVSCHAAESAEELIRSATVAMQAAKDQGRDRMVFDDPSLREEAERLLTLAEHARDGILANRFIPWFMPIVDLGTRDVVGHEALMRWDFPGGVLEPKEFTTALIEARLIDQVDRMILRQSLAHLAQLPESQFVSVNVSPEGLAVPGFRDDVLAMVRELGVDPSRLHLELTETSLFRASAESIAAMTALAAAGVKWYVDDFGTGYSSLSHLHDLPISGLKLDASFTQGLAAGNRRTARLTEGLAGLSLGLHLDSVAEGIEGEAEASLLAAQGWRRGQGWLFGQPAPAP